MQSTEAPASAAAALSPKVTLFRRAQLLIRGLLHEQSSPFKLGLGVALGVFMGCVPVYGAQLLLSIVLAQVFRLNKLAAIAGVQISCPPTFPFMVFGSIQLGHLILEGRLMPLSISMITETNPFDLLKTFSASIFLGGTIWGLILAPIFAVLTMRLVEKRRAAVASEPQLTADELDALDVLMQPLHPKLKRYAFFKVRMDPLYRYTLPLVVGRKDVVDLGSGIGVFGALLLHRSPDVKLKCVEWDEQKADAARILLGPERAVKGDARTAELGTPDTICLFDVMHYIPVDEQRVWLKRCVDALGPGGLLLVRELDVEKAKFRLSEKLEHWAVKRGWNRGSGVHAWPITQMVSELKGWGLSVEVSPCGTGLFSANALVVARKP